MNMDYDCACGSKVTACAWQTPCDPQPVCDIPLATAYVRPQAFGEIYLPTRALAMGTVFPELVSPWR